MEKLVRHFSHYVHSLNPDVAIEVNFGVPVRETWRPTRSTVGAGGPSIAMVYGAKMLTRRKDHTVRRTDLADPAVQDCRRFDNYCLTYMLDRDERMILRNMAHTAAFNGGTLACVGQNPRLGMITASSTTHGKASSIGCTSTGTITWTNRVSGRYCNLAQRTIKRLRLGSG